MKSETLIEKAKTRAHGIFMNKQANCAEAVFGAIQEIVDNDFPRDVTRLITPFGGGVGISGANAVQCSGISWPWHFVTDEETPTRNPLKTTGDTSGKPMRSTTSCPTDFGNDSGQLNAAI